MIFWIHNIRLKHTVLQAIPQHEIYSDASPTIWDDVHGSSTAHGLWSEERKDNHINVLKLRAALPVLNTLSSDITICHIQMFTDNTTAAVYINNMGGSRSVGCK